MILRVLLVGSSLTLVYSLYIYYDLKRQITYYESVERLPILDFDVFEMSQAIGRAFILRAKTLKNESNPSSN